MSWWLRGVGTSISLVFDSRGHWKVFGRPSGVEDYAFATAGPPSEELAARLRTARCAWQLSDALVDCPVVPRHLESVTRRSREIAARTHAVVCLLESPGQPDLLSFTLVVPPAQFDPLLSQFRGTLGRQDLRYSIFTPDPSRIDVGPADQPSARDFMAGMPHITAGVEFSFA